MVSCLAIEWAAGQGRSPSSISGWDMGFTCVWEGGEEEIRKERATATAQALKTEPWLCCVFKTVTAKRDAATASEAFPTTAHPHPPSLEHPAWAAHFFMREHSCVS